MKPSILIAEDEADLRRLLRYNLEHEGFAASEAANGDQALLAIEERMPDLLLVDWMMPAVSGLEICRRLRSKADTRNLPIIMITARGEEADRIRGLDTGADDYLTKPFSVTELIARIRAVLRRIRPALVEDVIEFGEIRLDRSSRRVFRQGREISLGPREFALLSRLMDAPGRVFTRAQLLDSVWGQDADVEERTVDVHVGRLRKSLNKNGGRDPIRTVRAAGYAIDETFARAEQVPAA